MLQCILYSTTNQCDTIGDTNTSDDDVSPNNPTVDET